MSKKQTQQNTVAWSPPPNTADTQALRDAAQTPVDYATPIRNAYARAKQNNDLSWQNPLGAYTTADVRGKAQRSQNADFQQGMGLDLSNAAQQTQANKFGQLSSVAQLTAPRMYGDKSTTTTSDPWGTALGIAGMGANVGAAALA